MDEDRTKDQDKGIRDRMPNDMIDILTPVSPLCPPLKEERDLNKKRGGKDSRRWEEHG